MLEGIYPAIILVGVILFFVIAARWPVIFVWPAAMCKIGGVLVIIGGAFDFNLSAIFVGLYWFIGGFLLLGLTTLFDIMFHDGTDSREYIRYLLDAFGIRKKDKVNHH
jgi:hypothetical protein